MTFPLTTLPHRQTSFSHPFLASQFRGLGLLIGMVVLCLTQIVQAAVLQTPASVAFTPTDLKQKLITDTSVIYGDRMVYHAADEAGQFILGLLPPASQPAAVEQDPKATGHQDGFAQEVDPTQTAAAAPAAAARMVAVLEQIDSGATVKVSETSLQSPAYPKFHMAFQPGQLKAGEYRLTAWLEDGQGSRGKEATWTFRKTNQKSDAPAFPSQGLAVTMETLSDTRAMALPMSLAIPLPQGAVQDVSELALFYQGKEIPAQFKSVITWGPGGSVRWAQAKFIAQYQSGKAEGYKLMRRPGASPTATPAAPAVKVEESADAITLDNGTLRFTVSKKSFTGIEKAWYDATGKGQYHVDAPIIAARGDDSGPFLMDERLVRFTAAADKDTRIVIEDQGSQSVTLLATGWYTDRSKRVPPLCQYNVRFTLAADQSMVKIDHHTVITFDTRLHKIRDLGFAINYTGGKRYAFGVDGKAITGDLPQKAPIPPRRAGEQTIYAGVALHQQTWDKAVVTNEKNEEIPASKSDGWMAAWAEGQPVLAMSLMHVWQKFPKELEARQEALVVHAWPSRGKRVFGFEEELALENIYKFRGFHQHRMLDLNLTQDYYEKLDSYSNGETRETRAEHALNGNGQGMTITTSMALHVSPAIAADGEAQLAQDRLADAQLHEMRPFAILDPAWSAGSGALEPMAATNPNFKAFEETIISGLLAYGVSIPLGKEYGMFIWPDTHTYWLPDQNRASLHRTWLNSHYHNVGNSWVLWLRSGDARMLRWARDNTLRYRDVATIAYAEPLPRENAIKFHLPGAMYHNKGCTPWGSETHGMIRRDTHAGLYGHWVDADAHLYAWLIDGEPRARDLYHLWASSLKTYGYMHGGVRREANTTLAILLHAYQYTLDADYLPAIHNLGLTLRTAEPLPKQNPGPMWHPLWINRYYQLTRDPAYEPFILEHARTPQLGNTWNLALAAQAYEISGDASYLTQHLGKVSIFPRKVYRQAGADYDFYGMGPGPLGMNWGEMGVGSFMRALNKAGIHAIPNDLPMPRGFAPMAYSRNSYSQVIGWSRAGGELNIATIAMGIEGDAHRSVWIASDDQGKELSSTPANQAHRQQYAATVHAKPNTLTTLRLNGYGVIGMEIPAFDALASVLNTSDTWMTSQSRFHMAPMRQPAPVTITFNAFSRASGLRSFCSVIIKDATGKTLLDSSMNRMFEIKEASLSLDPAKHPLPWLVDIVGAVSFTIESEAKEWVIAPTEQDLKTMLPLISRRQEQAAR